jgi:hypothetical protein
VVIGRRGLPEGRPRDPARLLFRLSADRGSPGRIGSDYERGKLCLHGQLIVRLTRSWASAPTSCPV